MNYLEILFLLLFFKIKSSLNATTVNKCHYEGDFTIFCNKTKSPYDTNEIIRYARKINGLQYNDTLCSFTSSTCHKITELTHCYDKYFCHIENGWYNLPECNGHSYYTQLEYECQPAHYMCDKTALQNVFSGLVYSPSYPHSYKLSDTKICYLTISVPLNHYIEITIDSFNLLNSNKCAGDYVNIQEYLEVEDTTNRSVRRRQWKLLKTLCGYLNENTKFIAKTNTISITFRSLQMFNSRTNIDDLNFKIHFQAIPANVQQHLPVFVPVTNTTQITYTFKDQEAIDASKAANIQLSNSQSASNPNVSLWSFGAGVGFSLLFIILILIGVGIFLVKKIGIKRFIDRNASMKRSDTVDKPMMNNKNNTNRPVLPTVANRKPPQLHQEPLIKPSNSNGKIFLGDNESEQFLDGSFNSTTNPLQSQKPQIQKIQKGMSMAIEPRKLQAERPQLLQDLTQSRLLNKYKAELLQQQAPMATLTKEPSPSSNETTPVPTPLSVQESKPVQAMASPIKSDISDGGVYGASSIHDECGGVYGATQASVAEHSARNSPTSSTKTKNSNQASIEIVDIKFEEIIEINFDRSQLEKPQTEQFSVIMNEDEIHESSTTTISGDTTTTSGVVSGHQNADLSDIPKVTTKSGATTPRRNQFNPLHVILKDKNKYYTTEFI